MNRLLAAITVFATFWAATGVQAQTPEGVPQVPNKEEQTRIRKQSCALDRAEVREPLLAKDIFVDYRFLPVLLGKELSGLTDGWTSAYADRVIKYMLKAGWSAIETQKNYDSSTAVDLSASTTVLRFELTPAGSASCKGWITQYRYPLQALPWLREFGVSPDQCVAISELPGPTAEGHISVQRTRLYYDPAVPSSYFWRLDVRAGVIGRDAQLNESASATMHSCLLRKALHHAAGQDGVGKLLLIEKHSGHDTFAFRFPDHQMGGQI